MTKGQPVRVRLHTTLSDRVGCANEFEVQGKTVHDCLIHLSTQNADLAKLMWRENDQLNALFLIFLGDELIKHADLDQPILPPATIDIIPAISGGEYTTLSI